MNYNFLGILEFSSNISEVKRSLHMNSGYGIILGQPKSPFSHIQGMSFEWLFHYIYCDICIDHGISIYECT